MRELASQSRGGKTMPRPMPREGDWRTEHGARGGESSLTGDWSPPSTRRRAWGTSDVRRDSS